MIKDCSLLILSCDANIDVLKIFIDKLEYFKNNLAIKTYLCLEKEEFHFDGYDVLFSSESSWSKRIKDYLEHIETNYIILILDDFIIEKNIDTISLSKYIQLIQNNKKIVRITLNDLKDKKATNSNFENLNIQSKFSNYLVNLQISIWDKKIFYDLLRSEETPWQLELYGSIRARKLKDYDFLYLNNNDLMPIIYNKGWLIVRGKWNKYEIDRLHLMDTYKKSYFFSREIEEINYEIEEKNISYRITRRLSIIIRQILSYLKIYI